MPADLPLTASPGATTASALEAELSAGASALGLSLNSAQETALLAYLGLLSRWNTVYNLTAVRRPEDMLRLHVLDSLAVVAPVQRWLSEAALAQPRLLDVGSGGGLPGVVLALLCPALSVTCVDAVGKKATFIRQVAAELGLKNLQAQHARVETLSSDPGFDLITARAFSSLELLTRLTASLLRTNGVWAAMKGQVPEAEIRELPSAIAVFHVEQLRVPGVDAQRCLVWMRPAQSN